MTSALHSDQTATISYSLESTTSSSAVIGTLHQEPTATIRYFNPSSARIGTLRSEQTDAISHFLASAGGESPSSGAISHSAGGESPSGAIPVGKDAVRIGLYVGIAVCFVLLAVILVMVVGVILLWRRKPAPTKKLQGRPTFVYFPSLK